MFERIKNFIGMEAKGPAPTQMKTGSTEIPTPQPVKAKPGQITLPSFLKTATPSTATPLIRVDRNLANTDISTYRADGDTRSVIRDFVRSSPDLSAAVGSYVRTGITSSYTAVAKNPDGSFNPDATSALAQIITRMDVLPDYSLGYNDKLSIRSLSETFARELIMYGTCACELVLDKMRLPSYIAPISAVQIRMYPSNDARKLCPKQYLAGQYYDLDVPTFFMVNLDQDTLEAYPISPIEPAIQAVLFSVDFMNDIRRIVKKAIHPRVEASIDWDKFVKTVPQEYMYDTEKLTTYMNQVVGDIQGMINGMAPEDALVHFDSVGITVMDHGNTNLSNEYSVIQGMIDAKLSTGAKVLPTILGHSDGTANTASAEVLMFMKYVHGTVTSKLDEMFSKVLTLSVRLLGYDVFVEFKYDAINLRPESELEAFRAMEQSRVLELLSLGMLGDEEASIMLTGHLPPQGYTPLTGTGFRPNTAVAPAGDGYNGATNGGSTMNQNLKSDAPKGGARGDNKKKAEVIQLG